MPAMDGPLVELLRHKTWATLQVIEFCRGVEDKNLDATVPGTYGTIRETLRHLVDAEERYLLTVTGERESEPLPEGAASLDELAERVSRLGPRWENLAQRPELATREVTTRDGWLVAGSVPVAQAIHHATDHRTHVLTILGALGLGPPELDVWDFALAEGRMKKTT